LAAQAHLARIGVIDSENEAHGFGTARSEQSGQADDFTRSGLEIDRGN